MRNGRKVVQLNHFVGEQVQGPTFAPRRGVGAGHGTQVGFGTPIKLLVAGLRPFFTGERGLQALFDTGLPCAFHGLAAHVEGLTDLLIRPRRPLWTFVRV